MDNKKDDKYYINKIIENINSIITYTKELTYKELLNSQIVIDATMFRLVQLVENINHISKEYKLLHSNIEWGNIIGFRNGFIFFILSPNIDYILVGRNLQVFLLIGLYLNKICGIIN